MTNIKILNHGDYYDPSIGEKFASLSDLVSYFYKNPNELKEKNGDWIHLKFPLNFDEPTEVCLKNLTAFKHQSQISVRSFVERLVDNSHTST